MKKSISFKTLFIFFVLFISFASCSKDDEKNESDKITNYFIGKWKQNDVDQVWTFNADGTCVKDYTGHNTFHSEGTWHYIPDSKTLVTNVDGWVWVILSTTEKQWTGITVNSKKAYTYNRIVE